MSIYDNTVPGLDTVTTTCGCGDPSDCHHCTPVNELDFVAAVPTKSKFKTRFRITFWGHKGYITSVEVDNSADFLEKCAKQGFILNGLHGFPWMNVDTFDVLEIWV